MAYKKKEKKLVRCGDCANITPILAPHHLLNIYGEPTLGMCPYWKESRCTLLSWTSECKHFKPKTNQL